MASVKKEIGKDIYDATEHTKDTKVYTPAVDIVEQGRDIVLYADMPGVDEGSVDVTLEKNVLTIYGSVDCKAPEGVCLNCAEYGVGDYRRVFTLSNEVDREKIAATVNNGVLKLVMPKAETLKSRKIEVKAV